MSLFCAELKKTVESELESQGIKSADIANRITTAFCERNGGASWWVPMMKSEQVRQRNKRIIEENRKGASIKQLCKVFELSKSAIYDILQGE